MAQPKIDPLGFVAQDFRDAAKELEAAGNSAETAMHLLARAEHVAKAVGHTQLEQEAHQGVEKLSSVLSTIDAIQLNANGFVQKIMSR